MSLCFFVSDLHGNIKSYNKLFNKIEEEKPDAVFFGGDLLPSGLFAYSSSDNIPKDFIGEVIKTGFLNIKQILKEKYPRVFIILGNDDSKTDEDSFIQGEKEGLWEYIHNKKVSFDKYSVYGYSYIPPTPFLMKDWEKYDVSRYVDPGCVPPEEGSHSFDVKKDDIVYSTIKKDLEQLAGEGDLSKAVFLFHSPPYKTKLDRAALDGKMFDHAPLDVHIGSIAIQRFINTKQPLITLHGHVHESASITGSWQDKLKNTYAFSAAHNGKELALVRFDPKFPENAERELI
ncbi:MAG: metallophosphoesterase [Bacteroidales bacterium]|nr:metallophosphoesterase [Bacteroidales bacterium]